MKQRGRKSAAELGIAPVRIEREPPKPPAELKKDAQHEWYRVVRAMRVDWFAAETHSLLAQYCRHVVTANRVDRLIEKFRDSGKADFEERNLRLYDLLLRMQERESKVISLLMTRMRMTQQSSYDRKRTKAAIGKPPWVRG